MSFVTPAPYTYLAGNSAYPSSGLVALYNIANSKCYTSGSANVYDLSGNNNTLVISASSATYIAASSSLQINNAPSTASYSQIKSTNELNYNGTYPLHTTSSVFTIVSFIQCIDNGAYQPIWYIGNTTRGSNYRQIMGNAQQAGFTTYKIAIGSVTGTGGGNGDYYQMSPSDGQFYYWGTPSGNSNFGFRRWSMQSYSKSSQVNNFNLSISIRGYGSGSGTWTTGTLTTATLSTGSYPRIDGNTDGSAPLNYQTNLSNSYLYIGKNPGITGDFSSLPTFQFGGMAIYNRPLTTTEISNLYTYFINGRTP